MTRPNIFAARLLAAGSLAALAVSTPAYASEDPTPPSVDEVEDAPGIVVRDEFDPNLFPPDGILDPENINGVGQMVVDQQNGFLGTCTGSLINPRTVIFAAHCVNSRPADAYGAAVGGTPISFGFQQNNIPGLLNWLGILDPATAYQTNEATAIYNVEHVWYDPRSVLPPQGDFLEADIAIATLDTPAFDIPTWAMLFTPLDGQEHVTVTGYGSTGTNESIFANFDPVTGNPGTVSGGFRRRAAENYVSFLGSLDDRNLFLFGDPSVVLPQNLYMTSFSDPDPNYDPGALKFDFGLFGPDDVALPREGNTASGDSGGPLIVDEKYEIPVVVGVLSGGSRFFGPQPFATYGTHAFYQPLHAFWDVIVANNPYVYATNKFGNGQWTDPDHWVQAMDPNYLVDLDGELINRLPSTPGAGTSGDGAKFGDICFLDIACQDFTQDAQVVVGEEEYFVEGGPGTENFVPNNIVGDPSIGQRPRYFDVTLSAFGRTRLTAADITIDKLTVAGPTKLDIHKTATLTALGDFTQIVGWTNVDGTLTASEAFLMAGLLTGQGTLRAPFVTSAAAIISPGKPGNSGTLTIDGNLILASGTTLLLDLEKRENDVLAVTGFASLSDLSDPSSTGPTVIFSRGNGARPRHGQEFTVLTAAGGVEGEFGDVFSTIGLLRPELTYGANDVSVKLKAGSIFDYLRGANATVLAFAGALDALRGNSYDQLYSLYGSIDVMDPGSLSATLSSLAPTTNNEGKMLQQQQSNKLFGTVANRLSVMGSGQSGTLSVMGSPRAMLLHNGSQVSDELRSGFASLGPAQTNDLALPEGFSGFVSGGIETAESGLGVRDAITDGQQSRYFSAGLEREVGRDASFGLAFGHADGRSEAAAGTFHSEVSQIAAYGSYRLGGGAYVGGVASYETSQTRSERSAFNGIRESVLYGSSDNERFTAMAEAGVNLPLTQGLTLTPRSQLGYSRIAYASMDETGGETALRIDSFTAERVESRFGAKLAGSEKIAGAWTLTPEVQADYVRVLSGADDGLTVRFAAADAIAIALPGAGGDTAWGEVRGGLKFGNGKVEFGAGFETSIGREDLRNDRAMADLTVRF